MPIAAELRYAQEDHTLGQMLQHYLRDLPFTAMRLPHPAQNIVHLKVVTRADDGDVADAAIAATVQRAHGIAHKEARELAAVVLTAMEADRAAVPEDTDCAQDPSSAPLRRRVTRTQTRRRA